MKIKNAKDYNHITESVVTIGTFDGVHLGHQKIIKRLVKIANKSKLQALVLTFFPHPRMVLNKDTNIKLINTIDEKLVLLENFGVDHLVVKEFTHNFSRMSAVEFVREILVNKLHVKHIIIGYDHHFGRNRTANIEDLREFGEIYDFKVTEISAKDIDDVTISSTKIRKALCEGDIKTANLYLGYHFMFMGTVVRGRGLGKKMDFPTANLKIEEPYKLVPKDGSYVIKTVFNGAAVFGMLNIGKNPTVNGETKSIEMHLFDFSEDIYGQKFTVELIDRLRDEHKFDSIEALKTQLKLDRETSLEIIESFKD